MEEKIMKFSAGMLLAVTVVFSILYVKLPDVQAWALAREGEIVQYAEEQEKQKERGVDGVDKGV